MSKYTTLMVIAVLHPFYTWASTDSGEFCDGAGLLAQYGAISRIERHSVEQTDREVIKQAGDMDRDSLRVARHYSAIGYHSGLAPDAAFQLAKAHCVEAMRTSAFHTAPNKPIVGTSYE